MTKLKQAARQALEALESKLGETHPFAYDLEKAAAIRTLREALAEQAEQEPVKRFTSDDVKVAFENGYAAAMSVADIAKEAEQEPVFISNEQFRSMHFSKVTIYTQNDGKEVIVCTPIRTHIEGFWCEDLTCAKCYSAEFRLKHTALPVPSLPLIGRRTND